MPYIEADHYARKAIQAKRKSGSAIKHHVELDLLPKQMVITVPVQRRGSMVVKAKQAKRLEVIGSQLVQLLDLLISEEGHPDEYFEVITQRLRSAKNDLRDRQLNERSYQVLSSDSHHVGGNAAIRTKIAQETIGVHTPLSLKKEVENTAIKLNKKFADWARVCFEQGLLELDRRLWEENSVVVLKSFSRALNTYTESDKEQWSLRLSKSYYAKAVSLASEHAISRSSLAAMCIAVGIELLNKRVTETALS